MRRVHRAGREIQEERLVRRHLFGVGDHRLRLFDEVRREMVALFGRLLRFRLSIVAHEFGVVLIRVAPEKAVVPLEPAPERPPVVRSGSGHRLLGRQMPLAHAVRVVAVLQQDLGEKAVLERDVPVGPGVTGRPVRQARQMIGVVVAAGDDARPRRRTERRRVHVVVAHSSGCERVDVRRRDRAPVTAEMPEPHVVDDDEEHVGRAFFRPVRRGPCGLGHVGGSPDDARERRPAFVLDDRHDGLPLRRGRHGRLHLFQRLIDREAAGLLPRRKLPEALEKTRDDRLRR